MGKKSSKTPDVVGAAATEGEYSRETARDTTYADRPDQYNAFGNVQWGQEEGIDPATGEPVTKWTQTQTLDPRLQGVVDSDMGMMQGRADLASGMTGRINNEMGGAPDWEQFGDVVGFDPDERRQMAEDASYQKSANRMDPRFEREREALDIRLRNQGLSPGDQSYESQMGGFGTTQNDAYEQARLGSVAEGRNEYQTSLAGNQRANELRKQQISEYTGKRGFSLAEQNALREGQSATDISNLTSGG